MFFILTDTESNSSLLEKAFQSTCSLYLDGGWIQMETTEAIEWRKGYSLDSTVENIDVDSDSRGHFCIIRFNKSTSNWSIHHDNLRGFPIYYNDNEISNMPGVLERLRGLGLHERIEFKNRPVVTTVDVRPADPIAKLTIDEATVKVETELRNNIKDYLKYNNNDLCVDNSGGYDTTALQAIMNSEGISYELRPFFNGHRTSCKFRDPLMHHLREEHWGYRQLGDDTNGKALMTGYVGDEFLMRNPGYVAHVCWARGLPLSLYIEHCMADTYMTDFIKERYLDKIARAEVTGITHTDEGLIDALLHDFQMWHVDKMITVLPWKSRKIIDYGFGLDLNDILDQLINVRIQKNIIKNLDPALLGSITKYKNK